nr:hypothetical protein [candidate division Zixibacteria bacterium]
MRREIPLIITAVVGFVYVIQYFIPHYPFNNLNGWFSDWFSIIGACAIWLGALNLMRISFDKVYKKRRDWGYSIIIILSFALIVVIGFGGGRDFRDLGTNFDWLYRFIYTPLSATMFALLAFFVASASYRAFRARNLEASLLLVAAFFVMIGRVPVGDALVTKVAGLISLPIPDAVLPSKIATWIMNYINAAGQRAIMIGIALGIVSTSLRVILGIERAHLGGE